VTVLPDRQQQALDDLTVRLDRCFVTLVHTRLALLGLVRVLSGNGLITEDEWADASSAFEADWKARAPLEAMVDTELHGILRRLIPKALPSDGPREA
jgi:hypothetical protein